MCNLCSHRASRSVVITPEIQAAAGLVREAMYYGVHDHCVFVDMNIRDESVDSAIAQAIDPRDSAALRAIRTLSPLQRLKAIHMAELPPT